MNEAEQKVHDDIATHGWHVIKVGDPELSDFAYTIGLQKNFCHPELVIFGLPLDRMHDILNEAGELVRNGLRFAAGMTSADILDGHVCTFRLVPRSRYEEYLGWARWYYDGDDFPALQLIWPDKAGKYPWQVPADSWLRSEQPILGDGHAA